MAPRRSVKTSVQQLLAETEQLVSRLLVENRALRGRNLKLSADLDRVSRGWEQIKDLARKAPRRTRRR